MKKFLPVLAALAFFGCAEEPAEIETTVIEEPAEVITAPADDAMMADTTMMMEDDAMMADTTMTEGDVMMEEETTDM